MAKIVKAGRKYCVAHARTGKVLVRKGRRACYSSHAAAQADARKTKCRNMGVC